ncbi:hypothetical protein [Nocardia abscessus]|uniref:hypothetical protein n=1 Tax=Nocardia abscessus TaxID=120957 RepID=UPI002458756B|nr:hypothetical protein [Nocardia abscessus]
MLIAPLPGTAEAGPTACRARCRHRVALLVLAAEDAERQIQRRGLHPGGDLVGDLLAVVENRPHLPAERLELGIARHQLGQVEHLAHRTERVLQFREVGAHVEGARFGIVHVDQIAQRDRQDRQQGGHVVALIGQRLGELDQPFGVARDQVPVVVDEAGDVAQRDRQQMQ